MGYSIVNILGGLLIVTSTMVVVSQEHQARHSLVCGAVAGARGTARYARCYYRCAGAAYVGRICLYH